MSTDTTIYRTLAAYGLGLVDQHDWSMFSMTVDPSETWSTYDRTNPGTYRAVTRGRLVLQLHDPYVEVRPVVMALDPGASCTDHSTYCTFRLSIDFGRDLPVCVEVCAETTPGTGR